VSEDITVNEGSNVTLSCLASGRPDPIITWRLLNPSGETTWCPPPLLWRYRLLWLPHETPFVIAGGVVRRQTGSQVLLILLILIHGVVVAQEVRAVVW